GPVDASRHSNIGNDSGIFPLGEMLQPFRARRGLHDDVAATLQCRAHEGPHRGFILDQQDWRERFCRAPGSAHLPASFTAAAAIAFSVACGGRTTKLLPLFSVSGLFQQKISPPWARTMP